MTTYRLHVMIEEDDDGVYIATVPSLKGCHTQARSLDELMVRIKEAIELYLEHQKEDVLPDLQLHFVGLQEVEVNA